MTCEERLAQAATIGDAMADMLSDVYPEGTEQIRENWSTLMADCQRAGAVPAPSEPGDYMEEWAGTD